MDRLAGPSRPITLARLTRFARGGPPTMRFGARALSGGLPDPVVHAVLDLALRLGEAMLSLGAAAQDVTGAMRRVVAAFGLTGCHLDLTYSSIIVSYDPGAPQQPMTLLRVVSTKASDYGRLALVTRLVDDLGAAPVPPEAAQERVARAHADFERIIESPHPYKRWVVTLALSFMAATVAILLGGGIAVALVAGATTALSDRAIVFLGRHGIPPFFLQAVGAAIATAVAVGLHLAMPYLKWEVTQLPPSLVVASGIVVLVAGLQLVGAAEDAISGFPVTAGGRVFDTLLHTLGLVVGIGVVLDVAQRFGMPLQIIDQPPNTTAMVVRLVCALAIAGAWAVACYARPTAALASGVAGLVGWGTYTLAGAVGIGGAVASAVAAFVVGVGAQVGGRRIRIPAMVIAICGITPLLPGLAIYRGLFLLVQEGGAGGGVILLGAALTGMALASGVTLGETVVELAGRRRPRRA